MLTKVKHTQAPYCIIKENIVPKQSNIPKSESLEKDNDFKEEAASFLEPEILDPEEGLADENLDEQEDLFDSLEGLNLEGDLDILPLLNAIEFNDEKNLPQVSIKHLPSTVNRDNLQVYIREISRFPLLQPEEEIELTQKVRDTGDPDAAFRIVSSHLRLVVRIAMDFQRRWMQNVLDLIQEGNMGLLRAVNKFDPDKGIKFSYYATFWIRAYILKFIMDNWRMVKIGTTQAQRKLFYNLNKEKQKLIAQGFDPDLQTLSDRLGVSQEQITEMEQRLDSTDLSLDLPVGEDSGSSSRLDYLPALTQGIEEGFAESEINSIIHEKIASLIPKLSDKELFILENRLLTDEPVTLREIGEKYNVTRERIRQLEARLIAKVRVHLQTEIEDFSEDWIQNQ